MTPVNLSWYLCALFAVALIAASAITVHPDAQGSMNILFAGNAGFSILFGVAAIILIRLGSPRPKWLVRGFQAVAILATLVVVVMLGG